ncbi:MAG: hypothetical protein ACRDJP_00985 [Actinomycetota bacterium]
MSEINITAMEPDHYGVQVREGDTTTSHRVFVPPAMLDDLGLVDVDHEQLIRESIAFLLEREPVTSIMQEFALDDIPTHFPDYYDELQSRLAG